MTRSRLRPGWSAALALLATLSAPSIAPGGESRGARVELPPPTDPRWEAVELPGVARPTEYRAIDDGGRTVLQADAHCSASGRALELTGVDLDATPVLRWRWRAEPALGVPDETTRPGDDFAARVSVMFPFQPGQNGLLGRLRHEFASQVAGREIPGRVLYFVWSARAEPGARWQSPYGEEARMISLARGSARRWLDAAVDVRAAYREAFGAEPPAPIAVGLMTDSDNHCGEAQAFYADFRFTARELPQIAPAALPGVGAARLDADVPIYPPSGRLEADVPNYPPSSRNPTP